MGFGDSPPSAIYTCSQQSFKVRKIKEVVYLNYNGLNLGEIAKDAVYAKGRGNIDDHN